MSHVLSYRVGSLQKPHLPFARIAELGIAGLEMVWNEETTGEDQDSMAVMYVYLRDLEFEKRWARHGREELRARRESSP